MTVDLKTIFTELVGYYTKDEILTDRLWTEIEKRYREKGRHYHTLNHIDSLVKQLTAYKNSKVPGLVQAVCFLKLSIMD